MFKDVQQLRVAELEQQLANVKNQKAEMEADVQNLQDRLYHLESEQNMGLHGYRGKKKFSTWERLITKRKAYRAYQAKVAELAALPQKIAALTSEIEIAKMQTADKIANSGILAQIENAEMAVIRAEQATTLSELGITPADAVTMLEANGVTPLLDESDRVIYERPRNYRSRADLIAVHKMDDMPTNNRLSTLTELDLKCTEKMTLDGQEYEYTYRLQRNTMHVSLNDEVSSHGGGNWDNCHYTVLQPFDEMGYDEIGAAVPNDTYTRGGIALSQNAWILCPANQVEAVKQQNPHVHVLGYQGENSLGLAAPFLSQLGYRAESVGQWGWSDQESQQQFYDLMQREKVDILQHASSTDIEDEEFMINTNKTIAIFRMLRDHDLVKTPADFERLKPQIEAQVGLKDALNHILGASLDVDKNHISPNALVSNGQQFHVFEKKMENAGMPLLPSDAQAIQTRYNNLRNGTQQLDNGALIPVPDLVAHAMVNSLINSRTLETERAM